MRHGGFRLLSAAACCSVSCSVCCNMCCGVCCEEKGLRRVSRGFPAFMCCSVLQCLLQCLWQCLLRYVLCCVLGRERSATCATGVSALEPEDFLEFSSMLQHTLHHTRWHTAAHCNSCKPLHALTCLAFSRRFFSVSFLLGNYNQTLAATHTATHAATHTAHIFATHTAAHRK